MRITWLLVGLIVFVNNSPAEDVLLDPAALQQIKGWGVTSAPLDWDGKSMMRDKGIAANVYRNSGITIARVLLGTGGLYSGSEPFHANPDAILACLGPQIDLLSNSGINQFTLSLVCPPSIMRTYRSDASQVEGSPNGLRPEWESLFTEYIIDVLRIIAKSHRALPVAISIQSQPDTPPGPRSGSPSTPGCPYPFEQWSRIVVNTRRRMDRAGFSEVDMVGPEAYSFTWITDSGKRADWDRAEAWSSLAGAAVFYPARYAGDSNHSWEKIRTSTRRGDMWVFGSFPVDCRNDSQLVAFAFQQLLSDFLERRSTYWFWQYGWGWDVGPECLRYGRTAKTTPLGDLLSRLWQTAPPGGVVHRFENQMGRDSRSDIMAFVYPSRIVAVVVNPKDKGMRLAFANIAATKVVTAIYDGIKTSEATAELNRIRFELDVPPASVCISTFDTVL